MSGRQTAHLPPSPGSVRPRVQTSPGRTRRLLYLPVTAATSQRQRIQPSVAVSSRNDSSPFNMESEPALEALDVGVLLKSTYRVPALHKMLRRIDDRCNRRINIFHWARLNPSSSGAWPDQLYLHVTVLTQICNACKVQQRSIEPMLWSGRTLADAASRALTKARTQHLTAAQVIVLSFLRSPKL